MKVYLKDIDQVAELSFLTNRYSIGSPARECSLLYLTNEMHRLIGRGKDFELCPMDDCVLQCSAQIFQMYSKLFNTLSNLDLAPYATK